MKLDGIRLHSTHSLYQAFRKDNWLCLSNEGENWRPSRAECLVLPGNLLLKVVVINGKSRQGQSLIYKCGVLRPSRLRVNGNFECPT